MSFQWTHNGEDEGQLIMYSVLVLWPRYIMVQHKRSLCVCLPSEQSHIPELLLDTAVPLSEEAPEGPAVPCLQSPQDLHEDPTVAKSHKGELFVLYD